MTTWRNIEGFEGIYEVSDKGQVRSIKRNRLNKLTGRYNELQEKILKPNKVAFGYMQVTLYKQGKRVCRYVHNLVMESFVGEKPLGFEVNHKDENKENNCLDNLEYITRKANNNYGTRKDRAVKSLTNGKHSKAVVGTNLLDGSVIVFPSVSEARRQGYGSHISDVALGKRKHSMGYTWKYYEALQ